MRLVVRAVATTVLAGLAGLLLAALPALGDTAPAAVSTVVIPSLGGTYRVVSQGPLNAARFASSSPDPSASAGALAALASSITTYERVWQDAGGANEVQDLVVRFPTSAAAQAYLASAQHALADGEIVRSSALPGVPGARRTTYFATTTQVGFGEAITMRADHYVALISFFSSNTANAAPITATDARTVALAQDTALAKAPGGHAVPTRSDTVFGVGSLVVAGLLVALLFGWLWRLRVGTPKQRRERAARRTPESKPGALPSLGDTWRQMRRPDESPPRGGPDRSLRSPRRPR